jgi:hypothetical protein
MVPRGVLIERPSEYEELLARHATREQVRFFLEQRDRSLVDVEARHAHRRELHRQVLAGMPPDWRTAVVSRGDLDRFLFEPGDVVLVLGQDGLVANVAKYLTGQPVIGLNPDPERVGGVLVRHAPAAAADLIADVVGGRARVAERTMVEARLDDGQAVTALNEVFVGHASHQSARYTLELGGQAERQSSSGLIVTTGTGATGWAASLNRLVGLTLPEPCDGRLAYFVREAWPSVATGTTLTAGIVDRLAVVCELGEGGVVFGDGIEADRVGVDWGQRIEIGPSPTTLRLVE